MTKETFKKALDIYHDINLLEEIKAKQDKNYDATFNVPKYPYDNFRSTEVIDDFKEFIAQETEKAKKRLEEL